MSRHNILHTTVIEAPIEKVWKHLVDVDDWSWNQWTKLEVEGVPETGVKGKLRACYEGNDQDWKTFDFEFGTVSPKHHQLAWQGRVGLRGFLFSGYHVMRLEEIDSKRTRLIHSEKFGGLLPMLGLGLPYEILKRNYLLMNEALKKHVEGTS